MTTYRLIDPADVALGMNLRAVMADYPRIVEPIPDLADWPIASPEAIAILRQYSPPCANHSQAGRRSQ